MEFVLTIKFKQDKCGKQEIYLNLILNASITAEEICQKEFIKKFGCRINELISTKNGGKGVEHTVLILFVSPVEKKEEEEFWKSLKEWELARTIEVNSKKTFI